MSQRARSRTHRTVPTRTRARVFVWKGRAESLIFAARVNHSEMLPSEAPDLWSRASHLSQALGYPTEDSAVCRVICPTEDSTVCRVACGLPDLGLCS